MIHGRPIHRLISLASALGLAFALPSSAQETKPDGGAATAAPVTAPVAPLPPPPDSALPPLPTIDRIVFAKLHAGVIVSDAVDDDGHGGKVQGFAICHCAVESIWGVLTNHAPFPEFVPRVTSMEVSRRDAHGERALQTIDATISKVKYALDYNWDPATRHVDFHLVDEVPHDLKAVRGSWQLWPIDHGANTLVGYQASVDTGRTIPGFIRDYLADRGVKDNMDAIRKRAEKLEGKSP